MMEKRAAIKEACQTCGSTRPCVMCNGTGVYPYMTAEYKKTWGECMVCWGTGIDHI